MVSTVFPIETKSPEELAYSIPEDIPIIGNGIFLRVSRIETFDKKPVTVDVYSGNVKRFITPEEMQTIGNNKYVIEKYGQTKGKHMILTFDDGPDPKYSSQILDILSSESAHSTFFTLGENLVKYPELAKRMVREGHDVANHTFSHQDLDLINGFMARQEINQTEKVIRAVTNKSTSLFRIPYGGSDDASIKDDRRAILEAQKLGYVPASYDFDTSDWDLDSDTSFKLPELDGKDKVLLMHDGGGDRSHTISYLRKLIQETKKSGYKFTSLSRLYSDYNLVADVQPTPSDHAVLLVGQAAFVWPKKVINMLFFLSLGLFFVTVVIAVILAELQNRLRKPKRRHNNYNPLVSVIIPAYNEEKVIRKTVLSVLRSYYKNLEIIIIDDGSKDNTWQVIKTIKSKRVKIIKQINAGKAKAVNRGLKVAKGEIIISLDADTIFTPTTIGKMVRHFYDKRIGAVAGVVKVGNVNSWITRWQALEYITSINIERSAQAFLNSIVVAPGACSAWRKKALDDVGGYSSATMAEDCDLTLAVHKFGYKVVQDSEAIGLTECPENLRDLSKQRFRWIFGSIQSFYKHRSLILKKRYGWLGIYVIPKAIFGIILQLVFTPLLIMVTLGNVMSGNTKTILIYTIVTFIALILTAGAGLILGRERWRYITSTPAFRIVYSPLRSFLLYAMLVAAVGGLDVGWNKVARHGTVSLK